MSSRRQWEILTGPDITAVDRVGGYLFDLAIEFPLPLGLAVVAELFEETYFSVSFDQCCAALLQFLRESLLQLD